MQSIESTIRTRDLVAAALTATQGTSPVVKRVSNKPRPLGSRETRSGNTLTQIVAAREAKRAEIETWEVRGDGGIVCMPPEPGERNYGLVRYR